MLSGQYLFDAEGRLQEQALLLPIEEPTPVTSISELFAKLPTFGSQFSVPLSVLCSLLRNPVELMLLFRLRELAGRFDVLLNRYIDELVEGDILERLFRRTCGVSRTLAALHCLMLDARRHHTHNIRVLHTRANECLRDCAKLQPSLGHYCEMNGSLAVELSAEGCKGLAEEKRKIADIQRVLMERLSALGSADPLARQSLLEWESERLSRSSFARTPPSEDGDAEAITPLRSTAASDKLGSMKRKLDERDESVAKRLKVSEDEVQGDIAFSLNASNSPHNERNVLVDEENERAKAAQTIDVGSDREEFVVSTGDTQEKNEENNVSQTPAEDTEEFSEADQGQSFCYKRTQSMDDDDASDQSQMDKEERTQRDTKRVNEEKGDGQIDLESDEDDIVCAGRFGDEEDTANEGDEEYDEGQQQVISDTPSYESQNAASQNSPLSLGMTPSHGLKSSNITRQQESIMKSKECQRKDFESDKEEGEDDESESSHQRVTRLKLLVQKSNSTLQQPSPKTHSSSRMSLSQVSARGDRIDVLGASTSMNPVTQLSDNDSEEDEEREEVEYNVGLGGLGYDADDDASQRV